MTETRRFGMIGVFDTAEAMLESIRRLQAVGFRAIEAYTPYPVEELDELLPARRSWLSPLLIFLAAVFGAGLGYFIQYWGEVLDYPINVGGRPFNSWPAFIVGAFEIMLLLAVTVGFVTFLIRCRLPLLYHPLFNADVFERASRDRFVLCVEARDPSFDPGFIRGLFLRHGAEEIAEVSS